MTLENYSNYDGLGLGELVKAKDVTPLELVDAAIERIERHNPKLNGVIFKAFDQALREAQGDLPDGAFKGVPFLLKDIMGDREGWPTTQGTRFLQGIPATQNSELVNRFLKAGVIPLGKTNVPEIGTMPVTESVAYGPCRNPWNIDHTPGGSSGGSAAMVASGCVPLAHANDGGGSIRIPAASSGLVGLKPSRQRNPKGPLMGDVMSGLVEEHVVSRTVRDTAAMLDCTAGPDIGDPYYAPPQADSYLEESRTEPGSLRVALFATNLRTGEKVHPEHVAAVEETGKLLEGLGHKVEWTELPFLDYEMFRGAFTALWAAGANALLEGSAYMTGKELRQQDFEPMTWALSQAGASVTGGQYQTSLMILQAMGRGFGQFHQTCDVILMPTLGRPPAKIGEFSTNLTDLEEAFEPLLDYIPFTPLFNGTGQPSISLPLHETSDGLPLGLLFTADMGREDTLLRLAGQLEKACPWAERRPAVWG